MCEDKDRNEETHALQSKIIFLLSQRQDSVLSFFFLETHSCFTLLRPHHKRAVQNSVQMKRQPAKQQYYFNFLGNKKLFFGCEFYLQYHLPQLKTLSPWKEFSERSLKVKNPERNPYFEPKILKGKFRFTEGVHVIFGQQRSESLQWLRSHYITEDFEPPSGKITNRTIYINARRSDFDSESSVIYILPPIPEEGTWPRPTPVSASEQDLFFAREPPSPRLFPSVPEALTRFFIEKEIKGNYILNLEKEDQWFRIESNQELIMSDAELREALKCIYGASIIEKFIKEQMIWRTGKKGKEARCLLGDLVHSINYDNYKVVKSALTTYLDIRCFVCGKRLDSEKCLSSILLQIENLKLDQKISQSDQVSAFSNKPFVQKPKKTELNRLIQQNKTKGYICFALKLQEIDYLKTKLNGVKQKKNKTCYDIFTLTNLAFWHVDVGTAVLLRSFQGEWEPEQHQQLRDAFEMVKKGLQEVKEKPEAQESLLKYVHKQAYFQQVIAETGAKDITGFGQINIFFRDFYDKFIEIKDPWKNLLHRQKKFWGNASTQSWLAFDIGRFYCMWQLDQNKAKTEWALDVWEEKNKFKLPSEDLNKETLQNNVYKYLAQDSQQLRQSSSFAVLLSSIITIEQNHGGPEIKAFVRNSEQPHKITVISGAALGKGTSNPDHARPTRDFPQVKMEDPRNTVWGQRRRQWEDEESEEDDEDEESEEDDEYTE